MEDCEHSLAVLTDEIGARVNQFIARLQECSHTYWNISGSVIKKNISRISQDQARLQEVCRGFESLMQENDPFSFIEVRASVLRCCVIVPDQQGENYMQWCWRKVSGPLLLPWRAALSVHVQFLSVSSPTFTPLAAPASFYPAVDWMFRIHEFQNWQEFSFWIMINNKSTSFCNFRLFVWLWWSQTLKKKYNIYLCICIYIYTFISSFIRLSCVFQK